MLDGIRCLSMAWVVLGHSHLYIYPFQYSNMPVLFAPYTVDPGVSKLWQQLWFTVILGAATFSVDTFFWLSGFLASYIMIKVARKMVTKNRGLRKIVWGPIAVLARYLRLTPSVAMAIFIAWKLVPLLGNSALRDSTNTMWFTTCNKTWWKQILYIENMWKMVCVLSLYVCYV